MEGWKAGGFKTRVKIKGTQRGISEEVKSGEGQWSPRPSTQVGGAVPRKLWNFMSKCAFCMLLDFNLLL